MKLKIFYLASFLIAASMLSSCLDGDQMNLPPGGSPPLIEITYNNTPGSIYTLFNTGLRYFSAQTLLPSPNEADTITFAVTLQGSVDKDVTVTLTTPQDALDDNYSSDSLTYAMMTSDQYKFLSTSAVIPKGKNYAEFQVVLYPPNINYKKNLMLPVTATNDANIVTSSTAGTLYFHVIGNALAGLYTHRFIRYATPAGTGSPDTDNSSVAVLSPANTTTVSGPTGYYTQPNYIITFDDDGAGNLSNFKAVLDPAALAADWDPAGIAVATGPTISLSGDYKVITLKYTTLTRNVTDIYTKL